MSSNGRVLIVEDDIDLQPMLEFTFENRGFETVVMDNGAEAWSYLEALDEDEYPTVMIIDLIMPDVDGVELLRRCREGPLSAVPAVVLTGLDSEEAVDEAFEVGADDYVTKPFSPNELLTRVQRLQRGR